jgi:hypothetical protein
MSSAELWRTYEEIARAGSTVVVDLVLQAMLRYLTGDLALGQLLQIVALAGHEAELVLMRDWPFLYERASQ